MRGHGSGADPSDDFVRGVEESTIHRHEFPPRDAIPDMIAMKSRRRRPSTAPVRIGMSLADSSPITKTFFARVVTHAGIENTFDILLVVPEYVRPPSITSSMTLRVQPIQRRRSRG
jgi:hypothetical protein